MGVHEEPVAPELWVHNLEHGVVVFLHNCPDGCDEEVDQLSEIANEERPFSLVTAYSDLPARFAAVAWGYRLVTDCFDRDTFEAFYVEHADRAVESTIESIDLSDPICQ